MKNILITGIAGFIGSHLALFLKNRGDFVIGIDNFNPYYAVSLKKDRATRLKEQNIEVIEADICETDALTDLLKKHRISCLVHLAAQAGVRHSLTHPKDYVRANLEGFVSVLEACRNAQILKLVYASSSSVYGINRAQPFSTADRTDAPSNLYGATKKANELMAHAYHHLYGFSTIGLRYFTVYGPWGRPDMAYYSFAEKISKNVPIQVFNQGDMERDFTYIDDIVKGTAAAIDASIDCDVYNLGNHHPVPLPYLIELLEQGLGKEAIQEKMPLQPGEVLKTFAEIEKSEHELGFFPTTSIEQGIELFIEWYLTYHMSNAPSSDETHRIVTR